MEAKRADVPALTTTFTPATSCTVDFYRFSYTDSARYCLAGTVTIPCNYYHLGQSTSDPACFPPDWSSATDAVYSPGICPVGYTEACTYVYNSQTLATCCPTGYNCQTDTGLAFYSTNICSSQMASSQSFIFTTTILGRGQVLSSVIQKEGLNAFGIRISYASSDFATTSSAVVSSSSSPISGASSAAATSDAPGPSSSAAAASDAPEPSSSSSSGLSKGATIGIGVGVSLGALAFIGALVFLFLKHRKKGLAARAQAAESGNIPMDGQNPAPGGPRDGYEVVPTGSPEPYNLESKFYGTPSPAPPTVLPSSASPPPLTHYAEVSGDGIGHALELQGDDGVRR